jgi:HAD superfamily hydrolase (TIGR01509 family)
VSQPRIRAVVFDLDGLMLNTEDVFHLTGHELLRRRGKIATQELFNLMMGRRANESFQAMKEFMQLQDSVEALALESWGIFDSFLDEHLGLMPGLETLLLHIETAGVPKGVATSSDREYLKRMLGRFSLYDRFQTTLTAEDVTHGKPNPEIYLKAASKIGVEPHEMLVLEDSEAGTNAAAAAGAHIISVPHAHSRHMDFSRAKAVATSLIDPVILNLLKPS